MSKAKKPSTLGNYVGQVDVIDPELIAPRNTRGRTRSQAAPDTTLLRIRISTNLAERLQRLVAIGAISSIDEIAEQAMGAYSAALAAPLSSASENTAVITKTSAPKRSNISKKKTKKASTTKKAATKPSAKTVATKQPAKKKTAQKKVATKGAKKAVKK